MKLLQGMNDFQMDRGHLNMFKVKGISFNTHSRACLVSSFEVFQSVCASDGHVLGNYTVIIGPKSEVAIVC